MFCGCGSGGVSKPFYLNMSCDTALLECCAAHSGNCIRLIRVCEVLGAEFRVSLGLLGDTFNACSLVIHFCFIIYSS